MWKPPPKRTTRSTKENGGCMPGLFNVFYIQPGANSQKLLADRPHRSALSFRTWYSKKRKKLKLLTDSEKKLERTNDSHLEAGKGQLGSLSFNIHVEGRMPKMQCYTDSESEQLPNDDPVLQKTLDEVLERLSVTDPNEATFDAVNHQSEELAKVLETLKSNKELLLKVLQDPKILNLLLSKHIENLRVVPDANTDKPDTAESFMLDEFELFEKKCDRNALEDISKESDISQKLSRIVVLKPNSVKNQNSSDVIDPESPSQSSQSSTPSMEEFLPFHFLIQEIKKKLKQVFGLSQKSQQTMSMDEDQSKMSKKASGSISERIIDNFKPADLTGSSSSGLASQSPGKKSQSRVLHSCKEHGVNPCSNACSKFPNTKKLSRKSEDLLDVDGYRWSFPGVEVSNGEYENAVGSSQQMFTSPMPSPFFCSPTSSPFFCSPVPSPGREAIADQFAQTDKKLESLLYATGDTIDKLHMPDFYPETLDSHIHETTSPTETSSSEDFEKIINEIGVEYVQENSHATVIPECISKRSSDLAEQCHHDKFTSCSAWDLSEEQLILEMPPAPKRPEKTKKPERATPVSVRDSLLLDKIIKSGSAKSEGDKFRVSPAKIHFEDSNDIKVASASPNLETNLDTCVGDDEFKFGYMKALVEASGLFHSDASKVEDSSQLLDPSLYDEVETPSGEAPDDLKLLFDCINEVLDVIHRNSSSCMPWASFIIPHLRPFPVGEQLIHKVQRGLNFHFIPWTPITLEGIVKKDIDIGTWMDLRSGVEQIDIVIGDELLDKLLEEAVLELWN